VAQLGLGKGQVNDSSTPALKLPDSFDHLVLDALPLVTAGLGFLYIVVALIRALTVQNEPVAILALSLVSALIFLALWFILNRWPVNKQWAHPIAAGLFGLAIFNGLYRLYLTAEPWHTTSLVLVVVAASYFLLSHRWFALVTGATLVAWEAIMLLVMERSPLWSHFQITMIGAVGLAILIHTIRVRSMRRLEALRQHGDELQAEYAHRALQLETSIAVGQRITSLLDLDVLLNQVAELIQARYHADYVGIYLLDENSEYVTARAGTGEVGRLFRESTYHLKVGQEGLIGWVAANSQPACVNDVSQDNRYLSVEALPNTHSELTLPLRMGGTMLGVLDLQSNQVNAFRADDVPVLQLLADQVAIAINNASLYEAEKAHRTLEENLQRIGRALTSTLDLSEVLDLILSHLDEIVPYDRAAVMLRHNEELEFVAARGFPFGSQPLQLRIPITGDDGIYPQIYRTQRALAIDDVLSRPDWQQVPGLPQARSWLGIPLIRSNEVIGMLSLTRETPTPYNEYEVNLATAFAGQAAIALENARLYERVRRFNQQLEYEVRNRTEAIQAAYEQLEKLDRTKSDFISIASHELRTPLTVLRGYSQMLVDDPAIKANPYHTQLLVGIQSGAIRLHEIVDSMLDLAKIDSRALQLYPEPLSIALLLQLVTADFIEPLKERQLSLIIDEIGGLPAIEADLEALRKVFYHLVINGIKYTPDGGRITITGEFVPAADSRLETDSIEVVVSDTGIGIDPAFQELIFTKFYQTGRVALHSTGKTKYKGGGPGLGLTIARGIVEAHQGQLWVISPGYDEQNCPGSHFHVLLPLRQAK
jgi:signal transduction histidine kinase